MSGFLNPIGGGGGGGGNCSMQTGTYTGDGNDDRSINIGVNLAAKTYAYVIIKGNLGVGAVHRFEYGQGDLTMKYSSAADVADAIQAFTATGFQIGTVTEVNNNGSTYRYIAFWVD